MGSLLHDKQLATHIKTNTIKMAGSRVPVTMRDFFFDDPFFKSSWDNFDGVREKMFGESRDMWKRFDEDFRQMACMTNNIMLEDSSFGSSSKTVADSSSSSSKTVADSSSSSSKTVAESSKTENRGLDRQNSLAKYENGWMFPRRWMLPSLSSGFKDLDLFKEKDSEVIRVKEDEKKMEVSLDTAQYRPDELKISVAGKHEEKAEDGTRMVSRQFVRKYSLPQGAKPTDVVSNLSSDGVLVITVPKSNPALEVKINQK